MKVITKEDLSKVFPARVIKNELITPLDSSEDIYEITLAIGQSNKKFEIGQSVGLVLEGPFAFGNPYHFRLYTIVEHNTDKADELLKLCVKRCFFLDPVNGEEYPGIASNYLCDRAPGDEVSLLGPYSRPFHIPQDPQANIVMIGMGTGIAPFRAFLRHLYSSRGKWLGKVRLFYGAKTGLEMLYMNDKKNDISQYYDEETFRAIQAVSRVSIGDVAGSISDSLSDSIRQNGQEVWSMIQAPHSCLFIAGLEVMGEKLQVLFSELSGSEMRWKEMREKMIEERRYQEILY